MGQSAEQFFNAESKLSNAQLCDTLLKQAAVNLDKQQWDYAIEKYGKVLEIDEKNLAARYFRAYAHTKLRHYDWAKSDYEDVLKIVPKHFETQLGLAYLYEKMGKKRDAFDMYNRIVQQFPDSASASPPVLSMSRQTVSPKWRSTTGSRLSGAVPQTRTT